MNEEQCMCYITYAVPKSMIPAFMQGAITPPEPQNSLYPPDFVPEWYRKSSFPEDDFEE